MTDERRKEAEEYAEGMYNDPFCEKPPRAEDIVQAYMAGDEAGARREREEIVAWLRRVASDHRGQPVYEEPETIADMIERGEHRGER